MKNYPEDRNKRVTQERYDKIKPKNYQNSSL